MSKERLFGLDNLKWFVILLVVLVHMVISYVDLMQGAEWYFHPTIASEIIPYAISYPLIMFMSTVSMPTFFLISGYFVPSSYDKQGFSIFLKKKISRLLVPALVVYIVCQLLFPVDMLHIWFLEMLFFFCLLYALIRRFGNVKINETEDNPLSIGRLYGALLLFGVLVMLVRMKFPVYSFIHYGPIYFEPAQLPNFVVAFFVGVLSRRYGWFRVNKRGLLIILGVDVLLCLLCRIAFDFGDYATLHRKLFSILCGILSISFSFFLAWLFQLYCNKPNSVLSSISANSMGIYLFHVPILHVVQTYTASWQIYFPLKFCCIFFFVILVSLLMTRLVKKIPVVGEYI